MEKEFTRLLQTHPGILYKVCHLYAKEEEDRKDLFQEIVLQLWKAFPVFRGEASASTWMYRIALNTAISNYRKVRRQPAYTPLSKPAFMLPDLTDQHVALHEDIGHLYAAITQLSAIEKALVTLYLEEKSYEEMAAILGISKSNVGVKLTRVKAKLEKLLKPLTQ